MNIYEDYTSYLGEHQELIEKMISTNSAVYYALSDVIKVTDYIYRLQAQNTKIDEDLQEIFEIGFGYLANVLGDLKTYYVEYFDQNMDTFNYYSELMLYSIYIEDFKEHLRVQELINDDSQKVLNDLMYKIDGILANKKPYSEVDINEIEATIDDLKIDGDSYKPVYNVFRLITEELEIE